VIFGVIFFELSLYLIVRVLFGVYLRKYLFTLLLEIRGDNNVRRGASERSHIMDGMRVNIANTEGGFVLGF